LECTGSWFYYAPLKVDFCALENMLGVAGNWNALVRGFTMHRLKLTFALWRICWELPARAMHWYEVSYAVVKV
jgi:hypothetical protein